MSKDRDKEYFGFLAGKEIPQNGKDIAKEFVNTIIGDYKKYKLDQIDGCTYFNSVINTLLGLQTNLKTSDWPIIESESENKKRIVWKGGKRQLIYLFKCLEDYDLIDEKSYKNIVSLLINTFYDSKKGINFKSNGLHKAKKYIDKEYQNMNNKNNIDYKQIDKVISEIAEISDE